MGLGHETALPTHDLVEGAVREVGRGQVAGVRVDRHAGITQTEGWVGLRQGEVGVEKGAHRAQVGPVALKYIRIQADPTE